MACVYILQSKKNGSFYIGSTDYFAQRIGQHSSGQVRSTKRLLPIGLVFKQEYDDIQTARKVEQRLKKLKRRDYLEKIISDGYIKITDKS